MRILSVIGTRPEAIKIAPIVHAAAERPEITHILATTGQHGRMIDQSLASFDLTADVGLALGRSRGELPYQIARIRDAVAALVARERPDLVLVQGDTTSAVAAALGAKDACVPIGHVEAGLRSGNPLEPYPEEGNRVAIDAIAALAFAPSDRAARNLAREGTAGQVYVTGNTGIDALIIMRRRIAANRRIARKLPRLDGRRLVLATCHRRENISALASVCAAISRIGARGDVQIVVPVHPNPAVSSQVFDRLTGRAGISLIKPVAYPGMVALLERCDLLLTDSGGLQEEAPALGKPTLVLRRITERQEAVETGNLLLVGTHEDEIVAVANRLLDDADVYARMSRPAFPFGDGQAAHRILDAITQHFARPRLIAERVAEPVIRSIKVA